MALKIKIITDIAHVDLRLWEDFVRKHPRGTVFQTPAMYAMYAHTHHMQPKVWIGIQDKEIVACLLAVMQYEGEGLRKLFTARAIVMGGPLVKDEDENILQSLLQAYLVDMQSQVIYTQIRNIYAQNHWHKTFLDMGFAYEDHLNLFLDVRPDIGILYAQLHKERKRNIRQAEIFGLKYREVTTPEEVQQISELIVQTYQRVRVPLTYDNLFTTAQEYLGKDTVKFFAAYDADGKMIAGHVRLCYKEIVYAWYAGSDEAYFKQRPNDFLMWNVICWAHEHGYKVFDFGGGGKPGVPYGVRDYKLKMGARVENYGRYTYVHKPLLMQIGKWGYKLYRWL